MFPRRLPVLPATARRAASSLSLPYGTTSQPCKPSLTGRGRVKPLRGISVGSRLSAAKVSRAADKDKGALIDQSHTTSSRTLRRTGGRTKRRATSRSTRENLESASWSTEELGLDYLSEPILSSAAQSVLHVAFTPPHMPLPVPLGTDMYFRTNSTQMKPTPTPIEWTDPQLGPFDSSLSTSPLDALADAWIPETGSSGLSDHLHVMYVLGRPDRAHHLGPKDRSPWDGDLASISSSLSRAIGEASARNRVAADVEWSRILSQLGDKAAIPNKPDSTSSLTPTPSARQVTVTKEQQTDVQSAVSSLTSLLSRLSVNSERQQRQSHKGRMIAVVGADGEEEWVRMDSTRRKRKTKMTKHKYKKRRKVGTFVIQSFQRNADLLGFRLNAH